uniref:Uncharacterized protein n=1 Tax=Bicosoecida sp. CB-2014 TaxID=1486930 RepID=A0A7S1CRL0_9STRA|mmetsp:Transcript_8965/g.31643  ORF Transcript_8965/g.31643 Transcript_8965/m.31643 type:complete len:388 (+) Transcript_8965:63-1226(+)
MAHSSTSFSRAAAAVGAALAATIVLAALGVGPAGVEAAGGSAVRATTRSATAAAEQLQKHYYDCDMAGDACASDDAACFGRAALCLSTPPAGAAAAARRLHATDFADAEPEDFSPARVVTEAYAAACHIASAVRGEQPDCPGFHGRALLDLMHSIVNSTPEEAEAARAAAAAAPGSRQAAVVRAHEVLGRRLLEDWAGADCTHTYAYPFDDQQEFDAGRPGTEEFELYLFHGYGWCEVILHPTYGDIGTVTVSFSSDNPGANTGVNSVYFWNEAGDLLAYAEDVATPGIPSDITFTVPSGGYLAFGVGHWVEPFTSQHWSMHITMDGVGPCEPAEGAVEGVIEVGGAMYYLCDGACDGGADLQFGDNEYKAVEHDSGLVPLEGAVCP